MLMMKKPKGRAAHRSTMPSLSIKQAMQWPRASRARKKPTLALILSRKTRWPATATRRLKTTTPLNKRRRFLYTIHVCVFLFFVAELVGGDGGNA